MLYKHFRTARKCSECISIKTLAKDRFSFLQVHYDSNGLGPFQIIPREKVLFACAAFFLFFFVRIPLDLSH